jgi:hypothetical protein
MTRKKKDTIYLFSRDPQQPTLTFTIRKMNDDLDVVQVYTTTKLTNSESWTCTCPAWKYPCKHVRIAKRIEQSSLLSAFSVYYSLNQDTFRDTLSALQNQQPT